MNNSTYTPQAGSLADRVCAYFLDNPSDELESFQIGNKFGVSHVYNVKAQLARAVDAGLLVVARDSLGEAVYGPGIKIDGLKPPAAAPTPAPAPVVKAGKHMPAKRGQQRPALDDYSTTYQPPVPVVAQKAESATQNPPPVSSTVEAVSSIAEVVSSTTDDVLSTENIDLDEFVIEDDVPLPPIRATGLRTATLYALLAKLKPKQSTQLPMHDKSILAKARADAHKNKLGTYTTRTNPKAEILRVWRVA